MPTGKSNAARERVRPANGAVRPRFPDLRRAIFAEDLCALCRADGVFGSIAGAQLDQVPARGDTGLLEMPGDGPGHRLGPDGTEAELDGGIAVGFGKLRDRKSVV